jgi:hypothetical protein
MTGRPKPKRLDVEVGQRYILKLPRSLPSYNDGISRHQLSRLLDELNEWVSYRPTHLEVEQDRVLDTEGYEPARLFGHDVVTVRAKAVIEPEKDPRAELDDVDRPAGVLPVAGWQPLARAKEAVVVHLGRTPWTLKAEIVLTPGQIAGLNPGLDPMGRYVMRGEVFVIDEVDGEEETPDVIEEKDFVVPVEWLRPVDSVEVWGSELQWDYILKRHLPRPEEGDN